VHSIVTRHGGAVSIDSAPGRGTTVTVRLPHGRPETLPEITERRATG
jgi:signal transduction histidine kinase